MRALLKTGFAVLVIASIMSGCVGDGQSGPEASNGVTPAVTTLNPVPTNTPVVEPVAEAPVVDAVLPPAEDGPETEVQLSDYEPVTIPELGLTLEVPEAAARLEPLWEWSVLGVPKARLGFNTMQVQPPMEPEAILPSHSLVLESEPVELPWGEGRSYLMEIYAEADESTAGEQAPVEAMQRHVVVRVEVDGVRYFVDFYVSSATAEGLEALTPLLRQMVASVTLE